MQISTLNNNSDTNSKRQLCFRHYKTCKAAKIMQKIEQPSSARPLTLLERLICLSVWWPADLETHTFYDSKQGQKRNPVFLGCKTESIMSIILVRSKLLVTTEQGISKSQLVICLTPSNTVHSTSLFAIQINFNTNKSMSHNIIAHLIGPQWGSYFFKFHLRIAS